MLLNKYRSRNLRDWWLWNLLVLVTIPIVLALTVIPYALGPVSYTHLTLPTTPYV